MVAEKNKKQESNYGFATILIVGSVLLSFLIGIIGGRYLYNQLKIVNKELSEKRNTRIALESKLKNLKALKPREAELKEKNKKVLAAIPDDKDLARLFKQFEDVAMSNGLIIEETREQEDSSLSYGGPVEDSPVPSGLSLIVHETKADTQNGYNSFKDTIFDFERSLRILMIKELEVTTESGFKVDFKITSYRRSATNENE